VFLALPAALTFQVDPPGSVFTFNANYGVHGDAGNTGLAGDFNGSIAVYGDVFSSSDAKLKKNIKELGGALTRIKLLPVKNLTLIKVWEKKQN
jgi:hypothetical protein